MKTERDRLFTVEDVATETGLSASTIRSYARDGLITPQRGWNTQTGRSPKKNRRCLIFRQKEIDAILQIRIERRSAVSRGLDRYWARVRNESS